ncbi:hypothetical protein D3C81_2225740 [compost metagenome]
MNHTRNAARFAIVIFWIVVVGLAYTTYSHSGNAFALSWATWLFYAIVAIVVLYVGAVLSNKLWKIK